MKKTSIGNRILALSAERDRLFKERAARLRTLHSELGFASQQELIDALHDDAGMVVNVAPAIATPAKKKEAKRKVKKLAKRAAKRSRKAAFKPVLASVAAPERKARVVITPELREAVIDLLHTDLTDIAIAQKLGLSRPTVQNIKRAAGMTRPRSKPSAEETAADAAALVAQAAAPLPESPAS